MIHVPCDSCNGTGHRPLQGVEVDTLEAVGSEWCSTSEIATRVTIPAKIGIPALCNRLVRLESRGLVERRALSGAAFEWRTTGRARKAGGREVVTTARKAG
jgi:hypothetical protein